MGFQARIMQFGTQIADAEEIAGAHGTYKTYNGVPFKPEGNETCDACGLCAENCPVSAIDTANPRMTDKERCISCMRCLALCPRHARDFDSVMMAGTAAAMAPKLGGHKENHLFL